MVWGQSQATRTAESEARFRRAGPSQVGPARPRSRPDRETRQARLQQGRDLAIALQEHAAAMAGPSRKIADTTENLPEHQRYDSREWLMAYSRCAVYLLHAACCMLDEARAY